MPGRGRNVYAMKSRNQVKRRTAPAISPHPQIFNATTALVHGEKFVSADLK